MKIPKKDAQETKLAENAAFRLLAIQTIVCVLMVLLVWLMLLIGGKQSWVGDVCREGLRDNGLLEGVSERLYGTTVTTTTTVQPIITEAPAITLTSGMQTGGTHADR